jgi:hypothetical protein
MGNKLFYGDNLGVLQEQVRDESIDLIYLDPPFNSNAAYNVLFSAPSGEQSKAQIEAFDDTWHWNASAELAFDEVRSQGDTFRGVDNAPGYPHGARRQRHDGLSSHDVRPHSRIAPRPEIDRFPARRQL